MISRLRWLGFAGGVLLAAAAVLAGAGPGPAPATQAEALWGPDWWFRLGLLSYLGGLILVGGAWWRLGRAWRDPERGPSLRWVLVTGALWAAPLLIAPPLGSRDLYAYACQGAGWLAGYDPYAVGAAGSDCPWLASVPPLWQETTTPYGPVALLAAAAAVAVAQALATDSSAQLWLALAGLRLGAVLGAVLLAAALPRLARACGVAPGAAIWLGAISPLIVVHVVSGGHNDALVAGLLVAGLALAASAAPSAQGAAGRGPEPGVRGSAVVVAAGAAIGLAVAVKVTALAALPFVLLLVLRRGWWAVGLAALAAGGSFAAVSIVTGLGVGWWTALTDTGTLVQWSSLPSALGMAAGYLLWGLGAPGAFDTVVAVARTLGVAALAVLALVAFWQAWQRRDQVQAVVLRAGVVLAAVVILGPVVYPWYAVAALAVLAASVRSLRARSWLAIAAVGLTVLTLPSGLGVPVLTKFPGSLLVAAACLVGGGWWLCRWRRRRQPGPALAAPTESLSA
ncbi:polyprenol phosphomannose-dependent alpha 1,6 mannosyltransferase MptB [Natronosporangium hydrolyticum]|uniref:Polyprenol phosphomannose-dependent alpha 1,6 mannosyltransferase MptB n=1 Tax=Natronosporangium hydrolyticum TaxID=2811111 RepID=A0A895YC52_9ACTN|nr:polyprenol phosphomannose-dependent alpha 1,6 mannosyltransferase MptB [Natronosporangium hydrolyticum]QSB13023.1 polyprenol phosphomannose-dependent alpha 1,6 mannosyltransferase MptB [Natronosporangium hydrolyticum]